MSDEELLIKYRKYKKKRMIIIFGLILIFLLVMISYLYFHFNNTSSPEIIEKKQEELVIKDEDAPIIKLKINYLEITKGDDIHYLDYVESAIDEVDGDLIEQVQYEKIDTSVIGESSIVYTVSDKSGNSSQTILSVLIKEETKQEENSSSLPQQSENAKPIQKNEPAPTPPKNEEIPSPSIQETSPKIDNTSGKIIKYFLFSDGYTMKNVAEVCATELRKTNKTGICSPIQDENGIYLGMKLETN